MSVLLLSPHFDDAVLSAGQFIAGHRDCDVVTVFAGMPSNNKQQTDYDAKTGFKNAEDANVVRKQEDDAALALLEARPIHLDFVDGQYKEPNDYLKMHNTIKDLMKQDYEFIVGPLGVGHPDHQVLSDLIISLAPKSSVPVYLWEDLPLRVVEPELVSKRLNELPQMKLEFIGDGDIAKKIRALLCYKSQIHTGILDPYLLYVPERFWRLK